MVEFRQRNSTNEEITQEKAYAVIDTAPGATHVSPQFRRKPNGIRHMAKILNAICAYDVA